MREQWGLRKIFPSNYGKTVMFGYLTIGTNIITGFILFPLIAKQISMEALGVFGFLYSLFSVVSIGVGWISASITKNLIKYRFLKQTIFTFSFFLNNIYGIIGVFIFCIYGYFFKLDYLTSVIYFSVYVFCAFAFLPYFEMLFSFGKQHLVAFFRFLLQFIFSMGSIGYFFWADEKTLSTVFFILASSSILVFVLVAGYYLKNFSFEFDFRHFNKKLYHKIILSDGKQLFLFGMVTIFLLQIDILLIDYLYGEKVVAEYLIVWKIPNTIIMLGWRLSEPFQVIVASEIYKNKQKSKNDFLRLEKKILSFSLFATTCYLFFGKIVLYIWMGNNVPIISYMFILPSIVIFLSIMQRLYISAIYYTKGLETANLLSFFELVLKVIFIVFFFELFGVLASVFAWGVGLFINIYFYRKNALRVFE